MSAPTLAYAYGPLQDVSPDDVLDAVATACGASADVYRGTIVRPTGEKLAVAVRRPRITSAAALERFESEVALRSRVQHASLLPLLGACTAAPRYATVSPWLGGGDACGAVHARGARFDFARVLALARQLAEGMGALHAAGLVHRDLKTANVLLDAEMRRAVVADLDLVASVEELQKGARVGNGRAMARGPSNGRLAHMVGTLAYLAPEVLQGAPHGYGADVYAYAVTVNELAAAAVPYVDRELPEPELHTVLESRFNDLSLRRAIVKDGLRPVAAACVPPEFTQLISQSWAACPEDRPSFDDVLRALDAIERRGEDYVRSFPASVGRQQVASSGGGGEVDGAVADLLRDLAACRLEPTAPVWGDFASGAYVPPVVDGSLSSTCGNRGADRMEDTALVAHSLGGIPRAHLFAVFDGHGGKACSEFAAENVAAAIFRNWSVAMADPVSVLTRTFQDVDAAFLATADQNEQSGCTAIAALVLGGSLFVANAGDCRCVLATTDGGHQVVTKDHVATDPDERVKIEARGGYVDLVSGRVQGRLAVSRAMGDRSLKRFVAAAPDVFSVPLARAHDFFILASDGLWDVVSSEEAADLVRATVRCSDLAAKRLALKAIELGSDDNISVIVTFLKTAT